MDQFGDGGLGGGLKIRQYTCIAFRSFPHSGLVSACRPKRLPLHCYEAWVVHNGSSDQSARAAKKVERRSVGRRTLRRSLLGLLFSVSTIALPSIRTYHAQSRPRAIATALYSHRRSPLSGALYRRIPVLSSTRMSDAATSTIRTHLHTLQIAHQVRSLPYLHPYAPASRKGKERDGNGDLSVQEQLDVLAQLRKAVVDARSILATPSSTGAKDDGRGKLARELREV